MSVVTITYFWYACRVVLISTCLSCFFLWKWYSSQLSKSWTSKWELICRPPAGRVWPSFPPTSEASMGGVKAPPQNRLKLTKTDPGRAWLDVASRRIPKKPKIILLFSHWVSQILDKTCTCSDPKAIILDKTVTFRSRKLIMLDRTCTFCDRKHNILAKTYVLWRRRKSLQNGVTSDSGRTKQTIAQELFLKHCFAKA